MEIKSRQLEIVEAAGKILSDSGVSGLTIKNLAKEMQFSESAIYRHFSSKDESNVAMLDFMAESMDHRLETVCSSKAGVEEKFISLFYNELMFFKKNPHFVVAVFSDGLMEESDRVNDRISKIMEIKKKYLLSLIKEGQRKGILSKSIPTEDLVHIVMGTFKLQMLKWRLANFNFNILENGNKIIGSLLTLIKNVQK